MSQVSFHQVSSNQRSLLIDSYCFSHNGFFDFVFCPNPYPSLCHVTLYRNLYSDRNDLGQFLSQYYKMDPNVLSCTVQFFIMRILRLTTVEDLEMLKFGDFIYQRDERGHEYFRLSDKLINFLRWGQIQTILRSFEVIGSFWEILTHF